MTKRHVAMGLAAVAAAGAVAVTAAVGPAGANEQRDLVVCNWSGSGLSIDSAFEPQGGEAGMFQSMNMQGQGCTQGMRPPTGSRVVLRLTGWDGVTHETVWWMPGQHMRLDITGPADSAQYTPTYW